MSKRKQQAEKTRLFIVDDIKKVSLRSDWKKSNASLARRAAFYSLHKNYNQHYAEEVVRKTPMKYLEAAAFDRINRAIERQLVRNL